MLFVNRYAYNVTMEEVNSNVTNVILSIPLKESPQIAAADYYGKLRGFLVQFNPLLNNYIKNEHSQWNCVMAIEVIFRLICTD